MSTEAVSWNPRQYQIFGDDRARPFFDLIARIEAEKPRQVVDLGCGPGNLTALLAARWPQARIAGLDSSPEMIAAAPRTSGVTFTVGDLVDWAPAAETDVVISNAALQWVPSHREVLARWCTELRAGSWLAFQVPGNFGSPSHTLMRDLAAERRWADKLAGVLRHAGAVDDPIDYARLLGGYGWSVDAWETTYLHRLTGPDPVLQWVRGTGLRPVLQALGDIERTEFETEYAARLRSAYPAEPAGVHEQMTYFPFRRIFVVGRRV